MSHHTYHPSLYTNPCIDLGIQNSFSKQEELQISKQQEPPPSLSPFRITKSLEPEGDGTIIDTSPHISIGNGAHRNSTESSLSSLTMLQDRIKVLFLFVKTSCWIIENIPCAMEQK